MYLYITHYTYTCIFCTWPVIFTVEPLLKDPSRKGQPLYKDTFHISKTPTVYFCMELIYFQLSIRGQFPYKGQSCQPQCPLLTCSKCCIIYTYSGTIIKDTSFIAGPNGVRYIGVPSLYTWCITNNNNCFSLAQRTLYSKNTMEDLRIYFKRFMTSECV